MNVVNSVTRKECKAFQGHLKVKGYLVVTVNLTSSVASELIFTINQSECCLNQQ